MRGDGHFKGVTAVSRQGVMRPTLHVTCRRDRRRRRLQWLAPAARREIASDTNASGRPTKDTVQHRKVLARNTSGTFLRRVVPFRSSAAPARRSALSLQPLRTSADHHHGMQL